MDVPLNPGGMVPSVDVMNKVVHLRSTAGALYTGKLLAGPTGFCTAEFEVSSLNYVTEVPNLMLEAKPEMTTGGKKRTRASTMEKPAAAEMLKKPAAADDKSPIAAAKPAGYPVGHVVFSDDESDGTEGADLEWAEEERPKVTDVEEPEPDDAPPAGPSPRAPAGPSSSAEGARRYKQMYYKSNGSMGIRRCWMEEGYVKPRQAFCFGARSGKTEVQLKEIGLLTIAKLEEGVTEANAAEWATQRAFESE